MDTISVIMTVVKVQTMADGGLRVTLDMSENDIMQMAQFAECKRHGATLQAEFVPMLAKTVNVEENGYGL
jgi:hypothetical protein